MGKVARVGLTTWFFGNLYEGLVGVPQLLARSHSPRKPGLLAVGSPVRYFAPVAGVALAPTAVSLVQVGRGGASPRLIGVAAGCVASAVGLSGYSSAR